MVQILTNLKKSCQTDTETVYQKLASCQLVVSMLTFSLYYQKLNSSKFNGFIN